VPPRRRDGNDSVGGGPGGGDEHDGDRPSLVWRFPLRTGAPADAIEKAAIGVIKPSPLRPAVEERIHRFDDFALTRKRATVTCPARHTVALSAPGWLPSARLWPGCLGFCASGVHDPRPAQSVCTSV